MPVFRIEKKENFIVMGKYHIYDKRLSCKAKGLLTIMLSCHDNWDYTEKGLTTLSSDGVDSIKSGLKELEKNGYLIRRRIRDAKGRICDNEYLIYEQPLDLTGQQEQNPPKMENPTLVDEDTDKTSAIEPNIEQQPKSDLPRWENPLLVKPPQVNTTQLNNNILNINKLNINIDIYMQFRDVYNECCPNLNKCDYIDKKRKQSIDNFLANYTLEDFKLLCTNANKTAWYSGNNPNNWIANFDFIIKADKARKLLESPQTSKNQTSSGYETSYDLSLFNQLNVFQLET